MNRIIFEKIKNVVRRDFFRPPMHSRPRLQVSHSHLSGLTHIDRKMHRRKKTDCRTRQGKMFWGGGEREKSRSDLRYRYIRGWWDERKRGGGKAGKNQVPAMDPRPRTFEEKQKPLLSIYLFVLSRVVCMQYTLVFFAWEDRELNAGVCVCVCVWRASLAGGQSVSEAEYRSRSPPVVWGKMLTPVDQCDFFGSLYTVFHVRFSMVGAAHLCLHARGALGLRADSCERPSLNRRE